MGTHPPSPSGSQNEKQILTEVGKSEKQLLSWIHSKGLLHPDVRELYSKVCSIFENAILNNYKLSELQDMEYSLWKVHYKHIDEFRKILKNGSGNAEEKKLGRKQNGNECNDNHMRKFKSFLSEATEYYKNLIVKLRKTYAIKEEAFFYRRGYTSASVEPNDLLTCNFLCHRFLVCMGDLARYREQYENLDSKHHNWSVAASHYFGATRIWPDSGNPQNQLAVLATYIGDEFLTLYHCVRSLAVKEPFPDAKNNLVLLLEKNRSCQLQYLSCDMSFNFLKPSDRATVTNKSQSEGFSNCSMFDAGKNHSLYGNLWPLIVRTISFFFIEPSNFEEFGFTFASTMRVLDKMMEQDDMMLKYTIQSYQNLNASRIGPFRAIQTVSLFIFVLKYLVTEQNVSNDKDDAWRLWLRQFAFAATFCFMGRFAERCLKAKPLTLCPLLPAVLVLAEWSVNMLDEVELYRINEEGRIALSYFVGVYSELVRQLKAGMNKTLSTSSNGIPLWEDYELRGFVPLASGHASLDFSGNWEHFENYESGAELRVQRLIHAAVTISNRSNDSQKQITLDFPDKKGARSVALTLPAPEVKEIIQQSYEVSQRKDILTVAECSVNASATEEDKSISSEEEEVILFRPLMRYNSAPLYTEASLKGHLSVKENEDHSLPADECLRRATSVLMAQNAVQSDQSGFHADFTHFRRNKVFKEEPEPHVKGSTVNSSGEGLSSAGPPSLNAWVLNRASFPKDKGTSGTTEHVLPPIEEIDSSTLAVLSISDKGNSNTSSVEESSATGSQSQTQMPYSAPVPSAPLLPEDAEWFTDDQTSAASYQEASQASCQSNWTALPAPLDYNHCLPTFKHAYPPPGKMTSSEWLRWYRENHNTGQGRDYLWSPQFTAPGAGNTENLQSPGFRKFNNHFDQWGNLLNTKQYVNMEPPPLSTYLPSAFNADDHKRERVLQNFQRSTPYGCGAVTDLRLEPQPLLRYLKEKEWQLQKESTPSPRSPSYMEN